MVTGGDSGLGFETALELARAGADVIIAGRNKKAALEALSAIRHFAPQVLVRFEKLDLANMQSVADFSARLAARNQTIDLLAHCAGIAESSQRRVTPHGFEMQMGVHFLGPFALTAGLLPLLRRGRRPRVVQLSSPDHRKGAIHFEDLQMVHGYVGRAAHMQSKLAALMFGLELQRRSDARGWRLTSVVAHPDEVDEESDETAGPVRALSILFAATSPTVRPGGFYGRMGGADGVGPLAPAQVDEKALSLDTARRLWETAETLTGTSWHDET